MLRLSGFLSSGVSGRGNLRCGRSIFRAGNTGKHIAGILGRGFKKVFLKRLLLLGLWFAAAFFRLSLLAGIVGRCFGRGRKRIICIFRFAAALFGLFLGGGIHGDGLCLLFSRLLRLWFAAAFLRLSVGVVGIGRTASAAFFLLVGCGCGKIHGLLVEYAVNEFFFFGGIDLFQSHPFGDGFELPIGHFFQFRNIVHIVAGGYSSGKGRNHVKVPLWIR